MNKLVVKLTTARYFRAGNVSACFMKTLTVMKRKSNVDISDFLVDIENDEPVNLHTVPDGLYTLQCCNESRDWESGIVDDWDLILVPHVD